MNQNSSIPTEEVVDLSPFKRMVMTIGTLPTAFTESMTYYEALAYFVKELESIIDAVNKNAEATRELQTLFVELKEYVDTYFSDLNVQEEINNKLDEMAEQGQLATIIAQFLEVSPVFAYPTISTMAAATNLADGCITKVLGKTDPDVGDGSFYRIRAKTESDVPDGVNLVSITSDDSIIAQIIPNTDAINLTTYIDDNMVNVKYNGAAGDGVTDDYAVLQDLIDNNPYKTLYFPEGEYLISEPLSIYTENNKTVSLKLDTNAVIKGSASIDYLLEVGANEAVYNRYAKGGVAVIDGGVWDAENCTIAAFHNVANKKETQYMNFTVINAKKGFVFDLGTNTSNSSDCYLSNLKIFGKGSEIDNTVGLDIHTYDNKIYDVMLSKFQIGILDGSGNYFGNVHVLMSNTGELTAAQFNKTVCYIHNGGGDSRLNGVYNDTCAVGFSQEANNSTTLDNCFQYWYKSDPNLDIVLFRTSSSATGSFTVSDCQANIPSTLHTIKGLDIPDRQDQDNTGLREYLPVYDTIRFTNIRLVNQARIPITDWIYNYGVRPNVDSVSIAAPWQHTMAANKYYPIAYLRAGSYDLKIRMGNYQIIEANINIGATAILSVKNIANYSQSGHFTLAVCNLGQDSDGKYCGYLCVKADTSEPFNPAIGQLHGWNQQVFIKPLFEALTSPTVNAESSFNPV